jgi:peptide/nickel transport system permease protein
MNAQTTLASRLADEAPGSAPVADAPPFPAPPAAATVQSEAAARPATPRTDDEAGNSRSGRYRALRAFLRNPTAMAGLLFLAAAGFVAIFASAIYPDDPLGMVARPFLWPGQNAAYPLGTDSLGRDVAAGIVHGSRVSLLVGISATVIGLTIGLVVGAAAGYFGGRIDDVLVRVIEIFQTMPSFILLVVLVAIAEPSVTAVTVAIGIVTWPTVARLVRAEFRSLRQKDFVLAARGLGYGHVRIIVREILPNALPPIIVTASVMVASAILMESALSFMGLSDPNVVSWGSMIGAGRELLRTAWYLTTLPGLAIVLTVLALNLVGDGLNDALNPRISGER